MQLHFPAVTNDTFKVKKSTSLPTFPPGHSPAITLRSVVKIVWFESHGDRGRPAIDLRNTWSNCACCRGRTAILGLDDDDDALQVTSRRRAYGLLSPTPSGAAPAFNRYIMHGRHSRSVSVTQPFGDAIHQRETINTNILPPGEMGRAMKL